MPPIVNTDSLNRTSEQYNPTLQVLPFMMLEPTLTELGINFLEVVGKDTKVFFLRKGNVSKPYVAGVIDYSDLGKAIERSLEVKPAYAALKDHIMNYKSKLVSTKQSKPKPEDDDAAGEDDDQTLAAALGLPEDALEYDSEGNVVFNAIVDGEKQQVKMQDLVKSYQLEGHVTKKSMKLESDRREFESTRDQAYDHLTKKITAANNLIGAVEQQLIGELQNIDWDTLRATDPGEWAATRQYYTERVQWLESLKAQTGSMQKGLTEEQQKAQQDKYNAFMQGEVQKMIQDNPAWKDQAVMAKEVGEVGKFLVDKYGFTPEEIANHMDARMMRMVRDAMQFANGKDTLKTKKVPDNVPKFRTPGQQNVSRRDTTKARQVKAQKEAIRKSGGSIDAIAQSLVDRM